MTASPPRRALNLPPLAKGGGGGDRRDRQLTELIPARASRRRPFAKGGGGRRLNAPAFAILLALASPAIAEEPAGLAWLSKDADRAAFLTTTPGECLDAPRDAEAAYLVAAGRVAFRSPFLFGGQAARVGLACDACHRDGRDNPDFYIDGLSSHPGTADVTSSLFSAVREDGAFNPRPIPDLVAVADGARLSGDPRQREIRAFIESAVVEEFQGAPPSPRLIDALAAYVAHFSAQACPDEAAPQSPRRAMRRVRGALAVAAEALQRGEADIADFALLSAQGELGRIEERYRIGAPRGEPAALASLSRSIGRIRSMAPAAPKGAIARLESADMAAHRLGWRLEAVKDGSLFDPEAAARRALDD